jgi:hypothetical protein
VFGCLNVFNYLSTVCDIFLIVLVYILSAAYYVSWDNFMKAVPDYGLVSLAVAGLFDAFLIASRAFSICIYLAISSALSIYRSSSMGSTDIVTDFVRAGFVPAFYCGYVSSNGVCLLDDGISVVCAVSFGCVVSKT